MMYLIIGTIAVLVFLAMALWATYLITKKAVYEGMLDAAWETVHKSAYDAVNRAFEEQKAETQNIDLDELTSKIDKNLKLSIATYKKLS